MAHPKRKISKTAGTREELTIRQLHQPSLFVLQLENHISITVPIGMRASSITRAKW
jgi:hypothetical protein